MDAFGAPRRQQRQPRLLVDKAARMAGIDRFELASLAKREKIDEFSQIVFFLFKNNKRNGVAAGGSVVSVSASLCCVILRRFRKHVPFLLVFSFSSLSIQGHPSQCLSVPKVVSAAVVTVFVLLFNNAK